jgi:hypothetical protein
VNEQQYSQGYAGRPDFELEHRQIVRELNRSSLELARFVRENLPNHWFKSGF